MPETIRIRIRNVMTGTFAEIDVWLDGDTSNRFVIDGNVYEAERIDDDREKGPPSPAAV